MSLTFKELRAMVFSDEGDSMFMRFPDGATRLTGFTAEHGMDDAERELYEAHLRSMYESWLVDNA